MCGMREETIRDEDEIQIRQAPVSIFNLTQRRCLTLRRCMCGGRRLPVMTTIKAGED